MQWRSTTPNRILVKADHSAYADTRWYTGSGNYCNVRLVTTASTHVPQWGVRITTPKVSAEEATVVVRSEVANVVAGTEVMVSLLGPSGVELASQTVIAPAAAPTEMRFTLPNPQRWCTQHAHLYTARTVLLQNGKAVDEVSTTFGIRSISRASTIPKSSDELFPGVVASLFAGKKISSDGRAVDLTLT